MTANVTVNEATGVTLRTLNVNITNPEKGTVTMTLNGSEVVAGASVNKDDKLIVTYAATAANYKASATIGGNAYNSRTEYTGIEDILSGTRVYAQDGCIIMEPTVTLQVFVSDMTGRVIWQGKLSERKQIAVSAGVYIVRLSNANGVQTQKVIVQ